MASGAGTLQTKAEQDFERAETALRSDEAKLPALDTKIKELTARLASLNTTMSLLSADPTQRAYKTAKDQVPIVTQERTTVQNERNAIANTIATISLPNYMNALKAVVEDRQMTRGRMGGPLTAAEIKTISDKTTALQTELAALQANVGRSKTKANLNMKAMRNFKSKTTMKPSINTSKLEGLHRTIKSGGARRKTRKARHRYVLQ
jgi:chromosome segregation ATPase